MIADILREQIVERDEYDMARLTEPFRGSPGVVLDIGAHHGIFTTHLLTHWPEATCHCYEPIPENANHIPDDPRIMVHRFALSDAPSLTSIRLYGNSGMWSLVRGLHPELERRLVRTVDIRDVLAGFDAINILKMDVECLERVLIERADELLERVQVFVLEDHDGTAVKCLLSRGFRVWYNAYGSGAHPVLRR